MSTVTVELSPDQEAAVETLQEWRARNPRGDNQYITLGGYAGTGKTTVIAYLTDIWENVAVAAYCGKAAHVLRSKHVNAKTIHCLIFVPFKTAWGVRYVKRDYLDDVETLIMDEASMIDRLLLREILSFQLPTVFVGDHGQLEPIGSNPNLMANPMLRLEQIHRQAQNNPIIRLATAFRENRPVLCQWEDKHGKVKLRGRREFYELITPEPQIVCGFNKTRHIVNAKVREMMGVHNCLVAPREKLICLKNNKTWNIFNGQQVTVLDVIREGPHVIELEVETDDRIFTLPVHRDQFGKDPFKGFKQKDVALMDYGYCLTAHKAQGSEWDDVLVLEEIAPKWDSRRWRYTVATRARKRLIYCR